MIWRLALMALVGAAAFMLGRRSPPSRLETVTRVDSVPPAAFLAERDALRRELEGLRAKLAGVAERRPQRIVITDTVVLPPDTVLSLVRVDARGQATLERLISLHPDSVRRRPEIAQWYDLSDCDDGWLWFDGQMRCNRPVLGHLGIYGAAGASSDGTIGALAPELGVVWRPRYRSGWDVAVGMRADRRLVLTVRKAWWVF